MDTGALYSELRGICERPAPFAAYTSPLLWNDPHISEGMLKAHLDSSHDLASIPVERIDTCVAWLVARLGIGTGTRVCDFGCGPGLWTTRLAEAGAAVTGIDLSARSIRYAEETARSRGLAIRYVLADYLDFATDERYDVVTMIHGDFSVLSPSQRNVMLSKFARMLDGGHLVLDVASMAQFREAAAERADYEWLPAGGFMTDRPHHLFSFRFRYDDLDLIADKRVIVEERRRFEIVVWNQCYSVGSLRALFESHGLEIVETCADLAGAPLGDGSARIAVIARRRVGAPSDNGDASQDVRGGSTPARAETHRAGLVPREEHPCQH